MEERLDKLSSTNAPPSGLRKEQIQLTLDISRSYLYTVLYLEVIENSTHLADGWADMVLEF